MRRDPLPTFCLVLELQGLPKVFLKTADFPTDTLLTFDLSPTQDRTILSWISQSLQGRVRAIPGNLVVLDTALQEVHRDAWDWGWIQQIVFPEIEAASASGLPQVRLALNITNLREVPKMTVTTGAGTGTGSGRKDLLPFFCFKVEVDGFFSTLAVRKIGSLIVNLGPNVVGMHQNPGPGPRSKLVLTTAESSAADFRAWKQSGGRRDMKIQYLSTALETISTLKYTGVTIDHIHPAAPVSVNGDTQVTMNIAGLTFGL